MLAYFQVHITTVNISGHNHYMLLLRYGRLVICTMMGSWIGIPTGYTATIGTVPEGYRPSTTLYTDGGPLIANQAASGTHQNYIRINVNGRVERYNYNAAGDYNAYFVTCWLTGDEFINITKLTI